MARQRFEPIDKALIWLNKTCGAVGEARMTGTGACVFAAVASSGDATAAQAFLARHAPADWRSFVARGINRSIAHGALDALAGRDADAWSGRGSGHGSGQ